MKKLLALGLIGAAMLASCARKQGSPVEEGTSDGKILIFGLAGVSWDEIGRARTPALDGLLARGAAGNVSVRVANLVADGYLTLGAGARAHAYPASGWVFEADEKVENGTAADMFGRVTGRVPRGEALAIGIERLRTINAATGFDAKPGRLADAMEAKGKVAAVIGNADHSLRGLPSVLLVTGRLSSTNPAVQGIHREAAHVVMRGDGTVSLARLGRNLLFADPKAPFGVATHREALLKEFESVWERADLVVVEPGETHRADMYALGLEKERADVTRLAALERADRILGDLLARIEGSALVVVVAPTTSGGPDVRGELRPVVLVGPSIEKGVLTSPSTHRVGIVTMNDLTATVARYLGVGQPEGFASGRPVEVIAQSSPVSFLSAQNEQAIVHDVIRAPVSFGAIGFELVIFVVAILYLRNRTLPKWLQVMVIATLVFPLASWASRPGGWRLGEGGASTVITAVTLLSALALRRTKWKAAAFVVTGATAAFFFIDLAMGAPAQLDSVLGYTSVAGGRYFGLGNVPFAIFSSSVLLSAGALGDRKGPMRWAAVALVGLSLVWIGHPRLGSDVGGTLTMTAAGAVFLFGLLELPGRARRLILPVIALAVLVVMIFGLIDLSKPPGERTHLGEFLIQTAQDPQTALVVARRKLGFAASLTLTTRWGLALPGAAALLIYLHRRQRGRWSDLMRGHRGYKAGLDALIVAAVVGSLVNDSGAAVGGMMMAVAAPWALLIATREETWDSPPSASAV